MTADPGQDRDVSGTVPEVAARLKKAQQDWAAEMLPMVGPDDRPYTVGYSRTTLLPARDGVNEGGIKRSSIHPNCSFFTNWTSKDDRMTWDIEVGQAGVFDVAVYFACKPADVGSTVEITFGNSRVRGKISAANDPPLIGKAQDRAARTESFVKDFRPLRLGSITLEKGRGKLSLRALEIAGSEVAEIRYVALTRT
jgi:hypothetical protein